MIRGLSRAVSRTARRIYYGENWRHHMTGRQTQAVPHTGHRTSCQRGSRAGTGDTESRSSRPAAANSAWRRRQAWFPPSGSACCFPHAPFVLRCLNSSGVA